MAITIPDLDSIDFLVLRKFPDADQIRAAYNRVPVAIPIGLVNSKINEENSKRQRDDIKEKYNEIETYRAQLESKSPKELEALFTQEQVNHNEEFRLKSEQEEQKRFWNQPSANADYIHWGKTAYWTLEEAIALSFGKNPEVVNWDRLKKIAVYPESPFIEQYSKVRDLVIRAKSWKQLYNQALPGFYIAWARRNDIPFPEELEKQVIARGGKIGDWKTAHDKLKENYEELLAQAKNLRDDYTTNALNIVQKKNEQIMALTQEKEALQAKLSDLETAKNIASEKPLSTREKDTLLKLVIGMAVAGYRYNPIATKNSAISEITDDLENLGITVSDDTVRKWLNEAAEFLPQEVEKT